jgi:hypothetical protein
VQQVGVDRERRLALLVLGDLDLVLAREVEKLGAVAPCATASAPVFLAISICFLAISGLAIDVPSR